MKNQIKKRITKIVTVVSTAAMVMAACVGCGDGTASENAVSNDVINEVNGTDNTEEAEKTDNVSAEIISYEFETYDGVQIVLDESNIIVQEPSDDPQQSELISEAAANNVIAPGRDYVYFEDDDYYYVADISRNLVTVADKSKVQVVVVESEVDENPGAFDTDSWSISYDTEKWYGYEDNGSVIINNLDAVAGSSYIEIVEFDVATVDDAVAMIQDTKGKTLTAPEKIEKAGNDCYVAYDAPVESEEEGVAIFDFYIIFEHNGQVIVINESITQDTDESRAEALSYEFDDVIDTFVLK